MSDGDGTQADPPSTASDDEDWERRVADWTAGRRPGTQDTPSDDAAAVPASYQPDPEVYEPSAPTDQEPRRRRFAMRHLGRSDRTDAATEATAPGDPGPDDHPADDGPVEEPPVDEAAVGPTESAGSGRLAGVASAAGVAGVAGVAEVAKRLRGLRGRNDDREDDDGPFFPPEHAPSTEVATTATRPRPRPRPSTVQPTEQPAEQPPAPADPPVALTKAATPQPSAVAAPPGDTPTRPRPRPRPGGSPATKSQSTSSDHTTDTSTKNNDEADGDRAASKEGNRAGTSTSDKDASGDGNQDASGESDKDDPPRKRRSWRGVLRASKGRRRIVKLVILVVVVVAAALALRTYVVAPYYIPSQSMEPTLHGCPGCNDDHVLVDKLSYRFHEPHAGDIVVFDTPKSISEPDPVLIKRVIAVGGEKLVLKHGLVYVNGKRISEPYFKYRQNCPDEKRVTEPETGKSRWQIPVDDVFVMGDNRCDSTDSRTFGPIPDSSIVGRAFVIVWPLQRFMFL